MSKEFPKYLPEHPGAPALAGLEAEVHTFPGLPFSTRKGGGLVDSAARRLQWLYAARQRLTARNINNGLWLAFPEGSAHAAAVKVDWGALHTEIGYFLALGGAKLAEMIMYRSNHQVDRASEEFLADMQAYAPWGKNLATLDAVREAAEQGLADIRFLRLHLPRMRHMSVVLHQALAAKGLSPELQERIACLDEREFCPMHEAERVLRRHHSGGAPDLH